MPSTAEPTPGRRFYDEQLKFITEHDVDGLIDNHYTPDAVLISGERIVRGRAALKEYFRGYLTQLGNLRLESTDAFTEAPDAIYFEATVTTKLGRAKVYDGWVLRDGKIAYHFTGVK